MTGSKQPQVRFADFNDLEEIIVMAGEFALVVEDAAPTIRAEHLARDGLGPDPWYQIFVVEGPDGLLGYAILTRTFNPNTGSRGLYIEDFFLREAARGKGLGRILLRALAARAADLGGDFLRWDVWRENKNAIDFYHAIGGDDRQQETFNMTLEGEAFEKLINGKATK